MPDTKAETIIRVQHNRENPFVMIERFHFEDPNLSWKAMGVHSYLLTKPNDWVVRMSQLIKRGPDGEHSTRGALNELKELRYLQQYPVYRSGKVIYWEITVYEVPYPECEKIKSKKLSEDGSEIINYVTISTNSPETGSGVGKDLLPENRKVGLDDQNLLPENLKVGFLEVENLELENQVLLNSNTTKNIELQNNYSTNQPPNPPVDLEGKVEGILEKVNFSILKDAKIEDELIEALKQTITNMYLNENGMIINKNRIPASLVQKTLSKIDADKLLYVCEEFSEITREKEINAPGLYLSSMIYNSVANGPLKIKAQGNFQLLGAGRS